MNPTGVDVTKKYNAFPSDFETLEQKKTERYGREYVKALWGNYILNNPINNPTTLQYISNRQFAEGVYPSDIYKNRMNPGGDASFMNLDYDAINRIPTIVDNMVGMALNKTWRLQCNPTDSVSKSKFEDYRNELRAKMFLKPLSDDMEKTTGIPLVSKEEKIPENEDELELHLQMNFKLDEAEAMELALKWVFDNNNFEKEDLPEIYRDLFIDKKTCIYRYYDENKNIKIKRWYHLKLITPYTTDPFFNDIPYQAFTHSYTIGQISKMNPKFTDEDLYNIAQKSAGKDSANGLWSSAWGVDYDSYFREFGVNAYRQFQNFNITIVNFFFLSPIDTKKVVKVSKTGRFKLESKPDNYKNEKGLEEINKRKLTRFEGWWVPDTDYIWDYKESENIDRDVIQGGYSPECELPGKIIMPNMMGMKNKSYVQRMIPLEKQLVLAWLKLQQFLIEAMPPGMAINQNALLDVVQGMGDGTQKPIDWTKLYKQTGNIIFNDRDAAGNPINIPFKELAGGISPAFEQFIRVQDYCISKMNEVIGFNAAVDGSTPKPDALVGVSQMAQQATYNCLRPLYVHATGLIESVAKRAGLMIQDSLRLGNEDFKEALEDAIGTQNVDVLIKGREMPFSTAAISVELQPDDLEMASLTQDIQLGIANGTLTPSDKLRINQQLKTNTKLAGQLMVFLEQKNSKEKQKQALELQKSNGDVQVQSAQAASQAQAQLDQILTQNKIALVNAQLEADIKKLQTESQLAIQLQALKNLGANTVAEINTGAKVSVADATGKAKIIAQHVANEGAIDKAHIDHQSKVQTGLLNHDSNIAQIELSAKKDKENALETKKEKGVEE